MATKTKKDLRGLWEDILNNKAVPPRDEKVWFDEPLIAFLYAKYKKGKRYSEKLEELFYGNVKAIYCYVYWVVNNLKLDRPEHLHNYMIAKNLENNVDDKEWVDLYFAKIRD